MRRLLTVLLTVLLLLHLGGCQMSQYWLRTERRNVDPVLSPGITADELVSWLNGRTEGLSSWRSNDVRVQVRMPGLPLPQKLTGSLACSAPRSFRLVAQNLAGLADFGSNDDFCWAYARPGEPVVLTWQHEDAGMLSLLPGGLPHLDSEWLMTILGVAPLEPADWRLESAANRTVRLVSTETDTEGRTQERSIVVDLMTGEAQEHVLRDGYGDVQVRVQLSDYRPQGGADLPHIVRVSFPASKTELVISIGKISENLPLEARLWEPPSGSGIQRLDVREVLAQLERAGSRVADTESGSEARANATLQQIADRRDVESEPVFDEPAVAPRRFRWFPFWP